MSQVQSVEITHAAQATTEASTGGCGGNCSCGEDSAAAPELDVRAIPAAIRHATVFGALGAIAPGDSLILLAPHEPVPLLNQLAAEQPGKWSSTLDQASPDTWRVRLTRAS